MKPLSANPKPLSVRQERFAEFLAEGMPASRAYVAAGYSDKNGNAEANSCRLKENDGVKARLAELKGENKTLARKTKADKLRRLEEIGWSKKEKTSDAIAAIKVHNQMTGDNEPTVTVVDMGPKTLDMVRERARQIASPLARGQA